MTIFKTVPPAGLLLTLRNDIAANSEHADGPLWFKYGAMAAMLHVERGIGQGADVPTVLDDLHDNILALQADRAGDATAPADIWPMPQQRQRYEG